MTIAKHIQGLPSTQISPTPIMMMTCHMPLSPSWLNRYFQCDNHFLSGWKEKEMNVIFNGREALRVFEQLSLRSLCPEQALFHVLTVFYNLF